jgi:hypothetical protein
MNWISVKERLPEGKGFVLVGNSSQWWCRPAWFDGKTFKTYEYGDRWLEVTHWQPLPEPPGVREDA